MGKFDSRNSTKMTQRKGQAKKKAGLKRNAEATRAKRQAAGAKKPSRKKADKTEKAEKAAST
jgi:hypothetical protein